MPLFVGFSEFVELLEAMAIDDFGEFAIGIVANKAMVVKHHQLAIRYAEKSHRAFLIGSTYQPRGGLYLC